MEFLWDRVLNDRVIDIRPLATKFQTGAFVPDQDCDSDCDAKRFALKSLG